MDRQAMIRSQMKELMTSFEPFLRECEERGYPVAKIRMQELFPGDATTPFYADVLTEWAPGHGSFGVSRILTDILDETVDKTKRTNFMGFCVEDTIERFMKREREPQYAQYTAI